MNKKRIYLSLLGIFLSLTIYIGFKSYNQPHNIHNVTADIKVDSEALIVSFLTDEEKANEKYKDKIIEVEGHIKEINFLNNRSTILLNGTDKNANVICDLSANQMEKVRNLMIGQKIKMKGICKGFLKDVIFLHCILINIESHE